MERELSRLSHVTREDGEYASQVKTPEPHSEPVDTQEKVEQAEPVTPAWMPAYEALRQDWNSLIEDARQTGTPSFGTYIGKCREGLWITWASPRCRRRSCRETLSIGD